MSTSISLSTVQATNSLKGLTSAVKATQNAWKASEAAMKSTGDTLGAAKARYDGLNNTIDAQKRKIAELKERQQQLNVTNAESVEKYQKYENQIKQLREEQSRLDTSTKDGKEKYEQLGKQIDSTREKQSKNTGITQKDAEAYLKLNKDIASSERQLESYKAQQDRAAKSVSYYESGLADLQKTYKQNSAVSESYVNRLKAEGKERDALKEKLKGSKSAYNNLNEQLQKQKSELDKIENSSGKASDAYRKQEIRVNETATSMAKAKSQMGELNSELKRTSPNPFARLTEKIKGTNKQASKTHSLFKTIFSANLMSNAVTAAWTAITTHIGDALKSGNEYLEQQDKMNAQWKTLTGSVKGAKDMTKGINDLATAAQNSAEMVNGLASQFYAVDKNKDKVLELSKATLTLQDAFGATDDAVQNFGKQWSQMMANGKVSAQDFMSFTDVFPALKPALLDYEKDITHNSKLTMKQLNDMISQGKISSETMNKVLEDTAEKNKKATENFGATIPGMTRTITATMPKLIGEIEKPFYKMKNPLVGSISKWVADKNTAKEFSKLGKALTATINDFTSAFGGSKLDGGKLMDKMLKGLTNSIKDLGKWAKTHKKDIQEFFGSFREKSADTIKVLGATMEAFGKVTLPIIKEMAKHPKVAGTFLAGFMIANKLTGPIAAIGALSTSIGKLAKLPKKMIFKPEVDGGGVRDGLKKVGSTIKSAGSGIKKGLKWSAEVVTTGAKKVVSGLGKVFTTAGKGAKKALQFTAKVAVKGAQKAMQGLVKTAQVTGKGLKAAFTFLKANPFILIVSAIAGVIAALVELYKHNKKFRNFVNGIVKSAKAAFTGVVKWFGKMKDGAIKHVSNMWKSTKSAFSGGWGNVKTLTGKGASAIKNHFNDMKNRTTGTAKIMWSSAKATFRDGAKYNQAVTKTMRDVVSGHWNRLGKDVKGIANSLANVVKSIFHGLYDTLNKWTGGRLGDMVRIFRDKFGALRGIVDDAKNKVKHAFVGLVRGVLTPFNKMLAGLKKGINWVLSKVGASKITADWSISLPSYARGTGGVLKDQLALVNDAKGSKYREMYATPDGRVGMFPAQRNMIVPLRKGTEILDGESSAKLAKMLGLNAYKGGTIGKFFSNMWDKGKDILDDAENIIAHPIQFLENVFGKFLGGVTSNISLASDIINHFPKTVANEAKNWIKKMFEDVDAGNAGNPGGSGVQRWKPVIKKAARKMKVHLTSAGMSAVLKRIAQESNGNPTITNNWDINAKLGHPSKGLLQYIQPTLSAWVPKGTAPNLSSGYAQLVALFNDSNWLRDISVKGGWGPTGHKRFANGGIVNSHQMIEVGENNKREAIIPMDIMKRSRAYQLLGQVITEMAGDNPDKSSHVDNGSNANIQELERHNKSMEKDMEKLLSMFGQLLGVNGAQLNAIKADRDPHALYQKMGRDMAMANYQSFGV